MSGTVLQASGLGKSYRTFNSHWHRVKGWLTGAPTHFTDHWVLRNVSFSIASGESIGVLGRNGAGKSTLLKMIAGTLAPTEGSVSIGGRISAILELGMGFSPEFTGRQNVFHACGLLGHGRSEIEEVMTWIEDFADIGEYFDQPLRVYSSGMQMRLAFAVATAFQPSILIVDEALSVGDAAFQRKSFRRIEEFLASGTTLLFVSHDTETIKRNCNRAIWLHDGKVELDGASKPVCDAYEKYIFGGASRKTGGIPAEEQHGYIDKSLVESGSGIETMYGDGNAEIIEFAIRNTRGELVNVVPEKEAFSINYCVRFFTEAVDVCFGMMIKTVDGACVYATNTTKTRYVRDFSAGDTATVTFNLQNNLAPGTYYLNCGTNHMTEEGRVFLHRRVDVAIFRILDNGADITMGFAHLHAVPIVSTLRA